MIRVTFGNNKQFDYIYYYCISNQIGLTNRFNQTEYYPYESIKKIEKQVKDLTLEKCHKLFGWIKLYKLGELNYFKDNMWHYIGLDEYIDITDLIKEQGKRNE